MRPQPAEPLPPELSDAICAAEEQAKVATLPATPSCLAGRLVFCMKEAAFKCQFLLSGTTLELPISPSTSTRRPEHLLPNISGPHLASELVINSWDGSLSRPDILPLPLL
jgi:hypothetical protein